MRHSDGILVLASGQMLARMLPQPLYFLQEPFKNTFENFLNSSLEDQLEHQPQKCVYVNKQSSTKERTKSAPYINPPLIFSFHQPDLMEL